VRETCELIATFLERLHQGSFEGDEQAMLVAFHDFYFVSLSRCIEPLRLCCYSFPVAASVIWNTLPVHIQSSPSMWTICQQLRTFLFQKLFP